MTEQNDKPGGLRMSGHELPIEVLGQAIRREREALGIGVRQMAARLGCSASHVSQVERGMTAPSVHTLFGMVRELGMSLDDLLAEVERATDAAAPAGSGLSPWPGCIVRAADRRSIVLPSGVKWELLIPNIRDGFEFVEYIYEVGGHDGEDSYRRNGWEYGMVLEGRLGGMIGFAEYVLETGDSITFDSSAPHRFWNAGNAPARAVWVWHSRALQTLSAGRDLESCGSGLPDDDEGGPLAKE